MKHESFFLLLRFFPNCFSVFISIGFFFWGRERGWPFKEKKWQRLSTWDEANEFFEHSSASKFQYCPERFLKYSLFLWSQFYLASGWGSTGVQKPKWMQFGSSVCLTCSSFLPALKSVVVRVLSLGPSSLAIHGSTPKLKQLLSPFGFCVAGTTHGSGIYVLWGLSHSGSPFQNTNPHLIFIILHVNCFTLKRDTILVC